MTRDAEATRQRLLNAALVEFATYGIAGARVDRIAENAASNKAQIYHYFGSKDKLFDAVFESIVHNVIRDVPITVDDLPAYAVKLAQGYDAYPTIARLATWSRLERATDPPLPAAVEGMRHKVEAIAAAQAAGILPQHYPAWVLLAFVLHLAAVWTSTNPEYVSAVEALDPAERYALIADAVRRLLT